MSAMASQTTGFSVVCSTVCSGEYQNKTSKLRITGLCEGTGDRSIPSQRASDAEMFPFDDVFMHFFVSARNVLYTNTKMSSFCEIFIVDCTGKLSLWQRSQCWKFHKKCNKTDDISISAYTYQDSYGICEISLSDGNWRGIANSLPWRHMCVMMNKSQATQLFSPVCSGWRQRKRQSSALLSLCEGNPRWLVDSHHKGLMMRKVVMMRESSWCQLNWYTWYIEK